MRKAHKAVAGVTAPAMTAAPPLPVSNPRPAPRPVIRARPCRIRRPSGPHELPNRLEDKHMWWSESGDDLENTMLAPGSTSPLPPRRR